MTMDWSKILLLAELPFILDAAKAVETDLLGVGISPVPFTATLANSGVHLRSGTQQIGLHDLSGRSVFLQS